MTDPAVSNRALAARAAGGDEGAFRLLIRRVHPTVYRWALSITGAEADADEVTQDVMFRMYRHLGAFQGKSSVTTWLYRITRNAAIDHVRASDRRRGRALSLDVEEDDGGTVRAGAEAPEPLRDLHAERLTELVDLFFHALPDRQREVFDLVDLQGHSPAEVAEMLDAKPVTVRANLFKARRAIRENILARHPELTEGYAP